METSAGVYGLTDPRNGYLRYIGKSDLIIYRYYDHCRKGAGRNNTPLGIWLKELFELGLKPGLMVLDEGPFSKDYRLGAAEKFLIEYFKMLGANLTNRRYFQQETLYTQEWYDKLMTSKGLPLRPYKKKAA